jgi:hypothetical protein
VTKPQQISLVADGGLISLADLLRAGLASYPKLLDTARKRALAEVDAARGTGLFGGIVAWASGRVGWLAVAASFSPLVALLAWRALGPLALVLLALLVLIGLALTLATSLLIDIQRDRSIPSIVFWDRWAQLLVSRLKELYFDTDAIKYLHKQSGYRFKQRVDTVKLVTKLSTVAVALFKGRAFLARALRALAGMPDSSKTGPLTFSEADLVAIMMSFAIAFVVIAVLNGMAWSHQHLDAAVDYYSARETLDDVVAVGVSREALKRTTRQLLQVPSPLAAVRVGSQAPQIARKRSMPLLAVAAGGVLVLLVASIRKARIIASPQDDA